MAGAEVDLFEGAREAGAVRGEGHLVHEAHSLRHEAHHVVQRVRRHFFGGGKESKRLVKVFSSFFLR